MVWWGWQCGGERRCHSTTLQHSTTSRDIKSAKTAFLSLLMQLDTKAFVHWGGGCVWGGCLHVRACESGCTPAVGVLEVCPDVGGHVAAQTARLGEPASTLRARVRPLPRVGVAVVVEVGGLAEGLVAHLTLHIGFHPNPSHTHTLPLAPHPTHTLLLILLPLLGSTLLLGPLKVNSSLVSLQVGAEARLREELPPTQVTQVLCLPSTRASVAGKVTLLGEPPAAVLTCIRQLPGVQAGVGGEVDTLGKLLPAGEAAEVFLSRVGLEVERVVGALTEGPEAHGTLVRPLPSVQPQVVPEGAAVCKGATALWALKRPLPAV